MRRWVPGCMTLWGFCTLLHIWIRAKWQLILLRVLIACLEAGFYPTTVSYLSLFYTRYEFAVRLGFFYGQTAVAGVLGSILSWAVFSRFEKGPSKPDQPPTADQVNANAGWKSWEVLFLIEGCTTMVVAFVGFFWLPHSADTAWFFSTEEKHWAEQRIRLDQREATGLKADTGDQPEDGGPGSSAAQDAFDHEDDDEAHHGLLGNRKLSQRRTSTATTKSVTEDSGLTSGDVFSAVFNTKIWHILFVNILSAIPATAFGIFLPMVVKQLSPSLNLSPSASNLLSAPPFACGAVVLFLFTRWSDRSKRRLIPIFWGLGLLIVGLTVTVLTPTKAYGLRYVGLCILLSGSFIASPLTVAWITNNTPEVGKRTIMLGINGWGNLAGIFLAVLFTPADRKNGYTRPLVLLLFCAMASLLGYLLFWMMLVRENKLRANIVAAWSHEEREREELIGDQTLPETPLRRLLGLLRQNAIICRLVPDRARKGDEKLTYRYTL
jgi:MFS family permease